MNIGGLDIGTTGCKLTVYQTDGTHLCTAYRAYDEMPDYAAKKTDPGLLHAGIIYEAVGEVIRETVKKNADSAAFDSLCRRAGRGGMRRLCGTAYGTNYRRRAGLSV